MRHLIKEISAYVGLDFCLIYMFNSDRAPKMGLAPLWSLEAKGRHLPKTLKADPLFKCVDQHEGTLPH